MLILKRINQQEIEMNGRQWSEEENIILLDNYPHMPSDFIAGFLNRKVSAIYAQAGNLNLKKSKEFLNSPYSGIFMKGEYAKGSERFRFPKGHIPFNKGMKQTEFMAPEAIRKTAATRFKKGGVPGNTLYDGCIQIRNERLKSGSITQYKWIRMAKAKWQMLHVNIWEKANGKVPPGFIIVFKDRNTMNCKLSNLEKISFAENMKRNTIHRYPAELKKNNLRT